MKVLIKYFTPTIIVLAILAHTFVYLIGQISEPSHVFSFTQNIKFMFGRVDWTPLYDAFRQTSVMFALAFCFAVVKPNWLKAIILIPLLLDAYFTQLQFLPIQLIVAESDLAYLLQENVNQLSDYPFSYQSFVRVGFSILLAVGLIINISQLYSAFKNRNY